MPSASGGIASRARLGCIAVIIQLKCIFLYLRTSAQRILEHVVRVSGWILEEPDPSAYRACYER